MRMLFLPILLFIPLVVNIACADCPSDETGCKATAGCFWTGEWCDICSENDTDTGQGYYCPGGNACAENGGKCSCPFPFYTTDPRTGVAGKTSINECVAPLDCVPDDNVPSDGGFFECTNDDGYAWDGEKCIALQSEAVDPVVQWYYNNVNTGNNNPLIEKTYMPRYNGDSLVVGVNLAEVPNNYHVEIKAHYKNDIDVGSGGSGRYWEEYSIADIKCVANEVDCSVFDKHTTCAGYDNAVACNKDTNCVYKNNICHYKAEYCREENYNSENNCKNSSQCSSFSNDSTCGDQANCAWVGGTCESIAADCIWLNTDDFNGSGNQGCFYRDDVGAEPQHTNCIKENGNNAVTYGMIGGTARWESGSQTWNVSACTCSFDNTGETGVYVNENNCSMKGGNIVHNASTDGSNDDHCDNCGINRAIKTVHSIWENIIFKYEGSVQGDAYCVRCVNSSYYTVLGDGKVTKCLYYDRKGKYRHAGLPGGCGGGHDDWGNNLSANPCSLKQCPFGRTTEQGANMTVANQDDGSDVCIYDNEYTKFCDRNGCFNINGLSNSGFGDWTSGVDWTYYPE